MNSFSEFMMAYFLTYTACRVPQGTPRRVVHGNQIVWEHLYCKLLIQLFIQESNNLYAKFNTLNVEDRFNNLYSDKGQLKIDKVDELLTLLDEMLVTFDFGLFVDKYLEEKKFNTRIDKSTNYQELYYGGKLLYAGDILEDYRKEEIKLFTTDLITMDNFVFDDILLNLWKEHYKEFENVLNTRWGEYNDSRHEKSKRKKSKRTKRRSR